MNPLIDSYARDLEIGRIEDDAIHRLIAALCLVLIGFYLAQADGNVPVKFRSGIATDYVHLLGRLLSSTLSGRLFGVEDDPIGLHLAREAMRVAHALAATPELEVNDAIALLRNDPSIPSDLRTWGAPGNNLRET